MTLSKEQRDGLTELINVGVGNGANALNSLVEVPVELHVPFLDLLTTDQVGQVLDKLARDKFLAVILPYKGQFSGSACLVFPADYVANLVTALNGENTGGEDPNELREMTLTEVGNIVLNGVMGTIGNVLKQPVTFSIPKCVKGDTKEVLDLCAVGSKGAALVARTRFSIKKLCLGIDIILFFNEESMAALLNGLILSSVMTGE